MLHLTPKATKNQDSKLSRCYNEITPKEGRQMNLATGIQKAIDYIESHITDELCAEFFPTSDYTPTYEMDIEAYPGGDMLSPDYKSQIWIPVVSE